MAHSEVNLDGYLWMFMDVYGCLLMFIDVYGCLLMFIYLFNGILFRFAMEHGWIHLAHGYMDDG
jgi:hypothetical protein